MQKHLAMRCVECRWRCQTAVQRLADICELQGEIQPVMNTAFLLYQPYSSLCPLKL